MQPDPHNGAAHLSVPRFVVVRPVRDHRSYCWRSTWNTGFDSAFSLLSKFALLNGLGAREIAPLFVSTKRGNRGRLIANLNIDFRAAECFSVEQITRLLNMRSDSVARAFVVPVHTPQSLAESISHLRYCRSCLRRGLHLAIYQQRFVQRCPLHAERLVETCEQCGGIQAYELASSTFKNPFQCVHCQHDFAPRLRRPKVICDLRLAPDERARLANAIELAERKSLLCGSAQLLERHFSFFGLNAVALSTPSLNRSREEYYEFIDAILSEFETTLSPTEPKDENCDMRARLVEFRRGAPGERVTRRQRQVRGDVVARDVLDGYGWDEKFIHLLPVYKAIRRRIWREILWRHRACIISAARQLWWDVEGDVLPAFCPFAEAFLRWRMFWEKFGVPADLYRRPRHAPFRLQAWLSEAAPVCPAGWSILAERWVTHRIFALDCWRHFHAWQMKCLSASSRRRHRWLSTDLCEGALTYWLAAKDDRGRGCTRLYVDARACRVEPFAGGYGKSHRRAHLGQLRRVSR